jgi:uncharacterized protein YaeQ
MAIKATVFKAELSVSDMDRHHYETHTLTIARHPSETDERMMLRLLAFALNASERLEFTKGISTDDEPDLWEKDLTGAITTWIELGQPDEKRLRKAAGRAERVVVYSYGGQGARHWWAESEAAFRRMGALTVFNVPRETAQALGGLAARGMALSCTVQDGQIWFGDGNETLTFELERLSD